MPKRNGYSASTWRRLDAAYRKEMKDRRAANAAKREARKSGADAESDS